MFRLVTIFLLISRTTSTENATIFDGGDDNSTITPDVIENDKNYCGDRTELSGYWKTDEPYKFDNIFCDVEFGSGYKVKLTIESFDLNPKVIKKTIKPITQDYVVITPGITNDSNGKGILLYAFVNETSYLIPSNKISMKFFTYEPNTDDHTGFKIKWERYGEIATTTIPTTTTEPLPTLPAGNDSITTYTVYISGVSARSDEIKQELPTFVRLLTDKSGEYCLANGIALRENITEKNVNVTYRECLYTWPESETCTEIQFAIPVFLINATEYQLNSTHLANIWDGISDNELPRNWAKYVVPDNAASLMYWLIASGVIVVLFFVFLFVVRHIQLTFIFEENNRQIVDSYDATPRSSEPSWPKQITPSLFEEDDYQYTNIRNNYTNPSFIGDDEFSEEEILNMHRIKRDNDLMNKNK